MPVIVLQDYRYCQREGFAARRGELQVGCMYELDVLALLPTPTGRQQEREIHKRLRLYRVRGEWFRLPAVMIAQIKAQQGA